MEFECNCTEWGVRYFEALTIHHWTTSSTIRSRNGSNSIVWLEKLNKRVN